MSIICTITACIGGCSDFLWSWPLVVLFIGAAVVATVATRGIQFRRWSDSWRLVLHPERTMEEHVLGEPVLGERALDGSAPQGGVPQGGGPTPFQAFLNTLSASMGNGSAAGMATAIYSGGPGVAFWIFCIGFFTLALRAVEVFASTYYTKRIAGVLRGGPFVFLAQVPGGSWLPALYAVCCLLTVFVAGCAMQCNSMSMGLQRLTHASSATIGVLLVLGVTYGVINGAQRILRISEVVVPIKAALFFCATLVVLAVHYEAIPGALSLIVRDAFTLNTAVGVMHGYTMWTALRYGVARSLSATEAGLGTAGVLFGATGSPQPLRTALLSMPALTVSNHIVCCLLILVFLVTGVWQSGLNGLAMTCAAYETVFGVWGSVLVTLLSITFGLGVLLAYALIGRECWIFLCGTRSLWFFNVIFCLCALGGATVDALGMWQAVDFANGAMLMINVYGLLYLMPTIAKHIQHAEQIDDE